MLLMLEASEGVSVNLVECQRLIGELASCPAFRVQVSKTMTSNRHFLAFLLLPQLLNHVLEPLTQQAPLVASRMGP